MGFKEMVFSKLEALVDQFPGHSDFIYDVIIELHAQPRKYLMYKGNLFNEDGAQEFSYFVIEKIAKSSGISIQGIKNIATNWLLRDSSPRVVTIRRLHMTSIDALIQKDMDMKLQSQVPTKSVTIEAIQKVADFSDDMEFPDLSTSMEVTKVKKALKKQPVFNIVDDYIDQLSWEMMYDEFSSDVMKSVHWKNKATGEVSYTPQGKDIDFFVKSLQFGFPMWISKDHTKVSLCWV